MKKNSKLRQLFLPLLILGIAFGIILGISYYTLYNLTTTKERLLYGNRIADLAQEIREELLKRSNFREVEFPSKDNLKLSGVLVLSPNPVANVVLCHGYQGSKEFMYGYLDLFANCNILLFDFRAHGKSEGTMTSIGVLESRDVIGAVRYLKETTQQLHPEKKIPFIILGVSMGGAAALKAAEIEPNLCDALIVDSVFCTLRTVMAQVFSLKTGLPHFPFFAVITRLFNYFLGCDLDTMSLIQSVQKITAPILFIHSCNDSFIEPKHCLTLYSHTSSERTKLWIGPKCQHGWLHTYYPEAYRKKVTRFLQKNVPGYQI